MLVLGKRLQLTQREYGLTMMMHAVLISVDEEVTLMDWGNAIVKRIEKDQEGMSPICLGFCILKDRSKTTNLKLTWLSESDE